MWLPDGLAPGKKSSCCRGSDQWCWTFVQEEGSDSNFHRKVVVFFFFFLIRENRSSGQKCPCLR